MKSIGNDWTINVRLGRIKCKKTNSHIYTFTLTKNFEDKIRGMEFNSMLLDGIDEMISKDMPDRVLTNFLDEFNITE